MDLFDSFSKKTAEAAAKAMRKAQDLAELTKLNAQIAEEEQTLRNVYCEIGKLYVSLHGSQDAPDFAPMIAAIHAGEEKIRQYQDQIQQIKGVRQCERCGAEVSSDAAFCSACGSPMTKQAPPREEAEQNPEKEPEEAAPETPESMENPEPPENPAQSCVQEKDTCPEPQSGE